MYCRRQGKLAILAVMFERKPTPPPMWIIYRTAAKVEWVGRVEATDQREAIAKAADEFGAPAARLIAVFRGQASDGS